jgi:hypothetical protein
MTEQPKPSGAERERMANVAGRTSDGGLANDWRLWGRISVNVSGEPYVRTTALTVGRGATCRMTMPARRRTAGVEDDWPGSATLRQRLCLALALWTGMTRSQGERPSAPPEGNHGEDVKDYWWYLDTVLSHAWNRWRH